jgi:hypothetical protein
MTNKNVYRPFLAVVAGILSTGLVALTFYPIVKVILDRYLHIMGYPRGNERKDELILLFTLNLWFFISSMIGGIVCTLIAKQNEWLCILLNIITIFLILIIISSGEIFIGLDLDAVLILLMIPIGNIAGKLLAALIKRKQTSIKVGSISDDLSF